MSKTMKSVGLGLLMLACLSLIALAADVSGTWEVTTTSQRGDRTSEMTIEQDVHGAERTFADLAVAGINMDSVTAKLLADGVKAFANSFDKLLVSIRQKETKLRAG